MTILVVGASGRLGLKIVRELVASKANVRVTHRASSKPEQIEQLRAITPDLVTADLADPDSLVRACANVDVVISAVQGLRDVTVDGQTRLLEAAAKAGVARMIPSDYAIDFFKTEDGGNRNLDLRREFNRAFDRVSVRPTSVLCGAFMDLLSYGAMGPDPKTNVFRIYGDSDQPYDFTHTDDVAKYIAAAALDNDCPRMLRVAGDTRSPRELAAIFEDVRKAPVTLEVAGSIEELDAQITRMRAADEAPTNPMPPWQRMQYVRDMATGLGRISPVDNARYPKIKPITVRELLAR
jgi:nucleoside-diphosphate-sugar epimerase